MFIGGASGTGKSSISYQLAQYLNVNVMEADDIFQVVKAMTTVETHPAIHYWSTGINWLDVGVNGNVEWLINVSKEIIPAQKRSQKTILRAVFRLLLRAILSIPNLWHHFAAPK